MTTPPVTAPGGGLFGALSHQTPDAVFDYENLDLSGLTKHPRHVIATFLEGREQSTLKSYRKDLRAFATWLRGESPSRFGTITDDEAAGVLLASPHGDANAIAINWRGSMLDDDLAPATINRRLSTLRSMSKMANMIGAVSWSLTVPGVKGKKYRDTRGPGSDVYKKILEATPAPRDHLALRLLYDVALRRSEVCDLTVEDIERENGTFWLNVNGKGQREKTRVTLPEPTMRALCRWLSEHPTGEGALICSLARRNYGGHLNPRSLYQIVQEAGERADAPRRTSPHRMRHSGITAALDATNGDVRKVMAFSRHARVDTVMVYDDNRRDDAGTVASIIAAPETMSQCQVCGTEIERGHVCTRCKERNQ